MWGFLITLSYCSNADKIREFIKNVYVDRKYAGGKTSDKPPRDIQVISFYLVYTVVVIP